MIETIGFILFLLAILFVAMAAPKPTDPKPSDPKPSDSKPAGTEGKDSHSPDQ